MGMTVPESYGGPGFSYLDAVVVHEEVAKGAAIGITFVDDTTFSLGEEGRVVIDEMVYDAGAQEGQFSANLVQSVFSFVSGQIYLASRNLRTRIKIMRIFVLIIATLVYFA